jgi:ATP-dependent Clp protease protease subunit
MVKYKKPRRHEVESESIKGGSSIHGVPPPDLPSLLLDQRIVYIGTPLTAKATEILVGELLWLNFANPNSPINVYINSTGSNNNMGEVIGFDSEAYAILDTLRYISPSYNTLCVGNAIGNAAMLLASGNKGNREALPNARIMTCPPKINRNFGRLVDQNIAANQLGVSNEEFINVMSEVTGRHPNEIRTIVCRNKYWTTKTAIEFGIIDRVLNPSGNIQLNLNGYKRLRNNDIRSSESQTDANGSAYRISA